MLHAHAFFMSRRCASAGFLLGLLLAAMTPRGAAAEPRELGLLPPPEGDLLGFEDPGAVPDLPESGELVVQKVRPVDCRVVRGFVHSPVDGRPDSWGYNGVVQEYDDSQGYGRGGHWQNVTYEFLKEPGVHVALADSAGFNYLYLQGGFQGEVYRDVEALKGPGAAPRVLDIRSATGPRGSDHFLISRHELPAPVRTRRISFFRREGLLADAQFFRIGEAARPQSYSGELRYTIGAPVENVSTLGLDFQTLPAHDPAERHPSNFERRFFRALDRHVFALERTDAGEGNPVQLQAGQQVHFVTPALDTGNAVGAVRLELDLNGVPDGNLLNLVVQDALVGNQELLRIDVRMPRAGRVRCLLDFPDQWLEPGQRFWITVASQHCGTLRPGSSIRLLTVPEVPAREEHLAWRVFLLKGYFYVLSEARPWNGKKMSFAWLKDYDGGEWQIQRVRPQLVDLFRTVEHCRAIAPEHPIAVRQYYDWLMRPHRPALEPEHVPALPSIAGVPRWAQLLDRAAREIVGIPNWWIAHRMAPNGELGGFLGDDTDMLQWWVPSALLDSESFRPRVADIFKRLNRLVLQHNLRDGVNLDVTDALHAYEEGVNHCSLLPLLFYGHPQHLEQLMLAARTTERWLAPTDHGTLRFRTDEFGWETAQHPPAEPPAKVSDNAALLLHPHLMLAWWNQDPRALQTIAGYLDDYRDRLPYAYGGGVSLTFGAYWLTGDPKYLRLPPDGKDSDGRPWARGHPEMVVHGTEARAQPWWDRYVAQAGRVTALGDWAWAAGQSRAELEQALTLVLWGNPGTRGGGVERYRYIWTEAEQFTDRVFLPVELVAQAMLGGYNVRNRLWPAYAVSYEKLGGDFAALVLEQGRSKLKLALINLREAPREGAFRVWQLDHGRYQLRVGPDANDDGRMDAVERTAEFTLKRMDAVPVKLPPRRLMLYELTQLEKLDDLYARADLAISEADLQSDGTRLRVTVHNLGRAPARGFDVALLNEQGQTLERVGVAELKPVANLHPSQTLIELRLSRGAHRVVLDALDVIPEITEANNTATLPAFHRP